VDSGNFADAEQFLTGAPSPLRNWEWRYLHAVVNPQRITLHGIAMDRVQCNQDKSEISVIQSDGSVHFVDPQTGRELRAIPGLMAKGLRPFAVSPDAMRLIAERRDFSICVLGPDGTVLNSIPSAKQRLTYVYTTLFTRDHSRFITSSRDDETVRIWDTATCQ
jgi:hypothetical protein